MEKIGSLTGGLRTTLWVDHACAGCHDRGGWYSDDNGQWVTCLCAQNTGHKRLWLTNDRRQDEDLAKFTLSEAQALVALLQRGILSLKGPMKNPVTGRRY